MYLGFLGELYKESLVLLNGVHQVGNGARLLHSPTLEYTM